MTDGSNNGGCAAERYVIWPGDGIAVENTSHITLSLSDASATGTTLAGHKEEASDNDDEGQSVVLMVAFVFPPEQESWEQMNVQEKWRVFLESHKARQRAIVSDL